VLHALKEHLERVGLVQAKVRVRTQYNGVLIDARFQWSWKPKLFLREKKPSTSSSTLLTAAKNTVHKIKA